MRGNAYRVRHDSASTTVFDHESLHVHQDALTFVAWAHELIAQIRESVAAKDHLDRAADGIVRTIARGNAQWSPEERRTSWDSAHGSCLECAACLDVLAVQQAGDRAELLPGKETLFSIVNMLLALQRSTAVQIQERREEYVAKCASDHTFFAHERLDVYQVALATAGWMHSFLQGHPAPSGLRRRLDASSTSVVLNIAEGNARFLQLDHRRFLRIAHTAAVHTAACLDLTVARKSASAADLDEGKRLLKRVTSMLVAMIGKMWNVDV